MSKAQCLCCVLCHPWICIFFLYLISLIYKGQRSTTKIFLAEGDKLTLVSLLKFLPRNDLKLAGKKVSFWGASKTIVLCIVWELAKVGSMAVPAGTWHLTNGTWPLIFSSIVLVLHSAHVKIFCVSCMRNFLRISLI